MYLRSLGDPCFHGLRLKLQSGRGTESAHSGHVTQLAAVRTGMSFLVVNESRMEMSCSIKARERTGEAPKAVTVQCKSLNGDMMHEKSAQCWHSSDCRHVVNKFLRPVHGPMTGTWKTSVILECFHFVHISGCSHQQTYHVGNRYVE